jgi:hypothetical protein
MPQKGGKENARNSTPTDKNQQHISPKQSQTHFCFGFWERKNI